MRTAPRRTRRAVVATAAALALLPLTVGGGTAIAGPAADSAGRPEPLPGDPKLSDYKAPVSDAKVTVKPIDFEVENLLEPGSSYTLRGFLYEPKGKANCKSSILQANHALTTGAWYWDIPFEQQKYSIARKVAASGIPFLSLNKLGYGQPDHPFRASDEPPGKTVTIQALAHASHQVTQQLREMGYQHVGLIGHSAGSEESEIHAGMYKDVDALILSGFTHLATAGFASDFAANEIPRAMAEDYPYFWGTIEKRDSFLFTDQADPKLVKALHPLVNETPSGEILSIGPQPSRAFATQVEVPVLTLIAEEDAIFDKAGAPLDEAAFVNTDDVTYINYPGIGHGVEFHRNGPEVTGDVVQWLKDRPEAMPSC
ncbi:MAG: alpha/beta hydrolase [Sporichthyaceae bacterium]